MGEWEEGGAVADKDNARENCLLSCGGTFAYGRRGTNDREQGEKKRAEAEGPSCLLGYTTTGEGKTISRETERGERPKTVNTPIFQ